MADLGKGRTESKVTAQILEITGMSEGKVN